MASSSTFRVIGYVTEHADLNRIPFPKLTHVNYAFLLPNEDGTFRELDDPSRLTRFVSLAHAGGARPLISVGGWGWEAQFAELASQPERRALFVRGLVQLIRSYQLDGADIDWEYPRPGISDQNFLTLMRELRAALPEDKLLSAAVVAFGDVGAGVPTESFALLDFFNIMAYDDFAHPVSHSSMECARSALDYWLGRGLPSAKAVLGVPFYSRPDGVAYSKIVETNPDAADADFSDHAGVKVNYNGVPTIRAKTDLALRSASGIMFWATEQDTNDHTSLLGTIKQEVGRMS